MTLGPLQKGAFKLIQVLIQPSALKIWNLKFLFFKWSVIHGKFSNSFLQDLQAQHATQKLKEQSFLDKTDYTTGQGFYQMQYPLIYNNNYQEFIITVV